MKVDLYTIENKKSGTIELPDRVFGVKWNPTLVHQALLAQMANARTPLAHVKDRSEVRGGGRKPYKQKHTGRARAGSSRSPLWAHGGVTHGPRKERNFSRKINKKMKQAALYSLLSKKLKDQELHFLDAFPLENHKTKNMAKILGNFMKRPQSALIIPEKGNRNVFMAARNIPKTLVMRPDSLNVYDCLSHKFIFIAGDAAIKIGTSE